MNAQAIGESGRIRRNIALDGEHPDVIVADVLSRPRPDGRVIVIANEKGGVGKSTIAFHLCVGFADSGLSVAAIDLDRRQQTLARALSNREATARRLGIALPLPKQQILQIHSGAVLCQEISRVGWNADVVVIDAAGYDSPIARRAIALADTLVTPINGSFVDLDLLGRFHPVTRDVIGPGCFATAVNEIRAARAHRSDRVMDWVVLQNRIRRGASHNQESVLASLDKLASHVGFRLGCGLSERMAYRELVHLGLTHLDIRHIPQVARTRLDACREITSMIASLTAPAAREIPEPAARVAASDEEHSSHVDRVSDAG